MLDVHPPTHAANTWRDFFIHIATIVVGLLIAIGLEQTVELLHHHHQVAETREALAQERDLNTANFVKDSAAFRLGAAMFQNDLLVLGYLEQHPGTAEAGLPGVLLWATGAEGSFDAAWRTAQQSGVTAFMPSGEVARNADLYNRLAILRADGQDLWVAVNQAHRYALRDSDPTHLTPAQVGAEIDLTEIVLMKQYLLGIDMINLSDAYPDFRCAFTSKELAGLYRLHTPEQQQALAVALAATRARLADVSTH